MVLVQGPTYCVYRHLLALILDSVGVHDYQTKNILNLAKYSWGIVHDTYNPCVNHALIPMLEDVLGRQHDIHCIISLQ